MIILLTACSGEKQEDSLYSQNSDVKTEMYEDSSSSENSNVDNVALNNVKESEREDIHQTKQSSPTPNEDRMIVYTADVRLKVKDFAKAEQSLVDRAGKIGGYMVDSNVYRDDNKQRSGSLTFRIPADKFESFLTEAEQIATEVLERNMNGQDVTDAYVDLQSRLGAKRVMESRLLEFMEKATKTEDLLKISADLAKVQEEIEQIVGRMTFLENQTAFSTVTLFMFEDQVVIPDINKDKLNTIDRTKQQLVKSTNFLLTAISSLFVFVVGNLPIIFVVAVLLVAVYLLSRRRLKQMRNKRATVEEDEETK